MAHATRTLGWQDRQTPRQVSVLVALALHALFLWYAPVPRAPEPERLIELALVQRGSGPGDAPVLAPEVGPPEAPQPPAAATPTARPAPQAPEGTLFPALAKSQQGAVPRVRASAASLRAAQLKHAARSTAPPVVGGDGGRDLATSRGRERCEPTAGRRPPQVVYLLFDSSGSMDQVRQAQALSCAHQYARFSIEAGAQILVANFARDVTFFPPTRTLFDVEAALRGTSDKRATILPSRELGRFFDQAADAAADLVIVSDGWFETPKDVLIWYSYFLELNPDNRGLMFTVGSPGHRAATGPLRGIGFSVLEYQPMRAGR